MAAERGAEANLLISEKWRSHYCVRTKRADRDYLTKATDIHRMNSQTEIASETTRPHRPMSDEHRKRLSQSMKKLWARRGGMTSEHRQKISDAVKKRWAESEQMQEEYRQKIALAEDARAQREPPDCGQGMASVVEPADHRSGGVAADPSP